MKCALELTNIAIERKQEIENEKILKEMRENEARREATIQFCEKIGVELEVLAGKGEKPAYIFECSQYKNTVLSRTWKDYADGRLSYRSSGPCLNLQVLREWFAEYCFKVVIHEFTFREFGYGYHKGYSIMILPDIQCQ
jgi:hypothetical protein